MKLTLFDFGLPADRIAQRPLAERTDSRLLLLDQQSGKLEDGRFRELPGRLRGDELLVVNDARVLPGRLFGYRQGLRSEPAGKGTRHEHLSAMIEVLLLRRLEGRGDESWEALVRPGRKIRVGEVIDFGEGELSAEVVERGDYGLRTLRFAAQGDFRELVERLGHVPLPPYIDRPDEAADRMRYQTVFARRGDAVAAPTAGLHFTEEILGAIKQRGCQIVSLTLEVGYGTFQPIHEEEIERHKIHSELYEIPEETAKAVEEARAAGRPVLAVGTTVVRALEDSATRHGGVAAGRAAAELYIYPGYEFKVVNQLLTNFHLPQSSLLILVSAFAGRENLLRAYRHAVEAGYRFYSYGDCMLLKAVGGPRREEHGGRAAPLPPSAPGRPRAQPPGRCSLRE